MTSAAATRFASGVGATTECAWVSAVMTCASSPPPCGEGPGVGESRRLGAWGFPPSPTLPRKGGGRVRSRRSSLLHPVQRLHVDVGEAENGDEEDDGEGGGIAGLPALERLAFQGDGREFRSRARPARG